MNEETASIGAEGLQRAEALERAKQGAADQRQRFEAWADDQGFPLQKLETSDGYLDLRTQGAWDAWQACAADGVQASDDCSSCGGSGSQGTTGCTDCLGTGVDPMSDRALGVPASGEASFDEAWKQMEAKGYRYGKDAIEQVRMGWELCLVMRSDVNRTAGVGGNDGR